MTQLQISDNTFHTTFGYKTFNPLNSNHSYVWSSSRKRISLTSPRPEDFDIEAIAKGLSKVCRFNAQSRVFYSVATHSILVSRLCPPHLKLHGLLHDGPEAYIHDLSKPLKYYLGVAEVYKPIEERFMRAIARKFQFEYTHDTYLQVKAIEQPVILTEIRDLMDLPEDEHIDFSNALDINLGREILPAEAQQNFLDEYEFITATYQV